LTTSKKTPSFRDYHVSVRLNVELSVRVAAATPEDALAKGREIQAHYNVLLDESQYDDINDGSAEVVGVWTLD
jgi:hypothetical protein